MLCSVWRTNDHNSLFATRNFATCWSLEKGLKKGGKNKNKKKTTHTGIYCRVYAEIAEGCRRAADIWQGSSGGGRRDHWSGKVILVNILHTGLLLFVLGNSWMLRMVLKKKKVNKNEVLHWYSLFCVVSLSTTTRTSSVITVSNPQWSSTSHTVKWKTENVTQLGGLCRLRGASLGLDVTHGFVNLGVLRVTVPHLTAGTQRDRERERNHLKGNNCAFSSKESYSWTQFSMIKKKNK